MPVKLRCVDVIAACEKSDKIKLEVKVARLEAVREFQDSLGFTEYDRLFTSLLSGDYGWGCIDTKTYNLKKMCEVQMQQSEMIDLNLEEFSIVSSYLDK